METVIAGAWHVEMFARQKSLKALKTYLPQKRKPVREMPDAEIFRNIELWLKKEAPADG